MGPIKRLLMACTLCLISTFALSFENEPGGFRGINWGTNIKDVQDMVKIEEYGSFKGYKKNDDKMKIGEADVKNIIYGFYENQFSFVLIEYVGNSNFSQIKDTLLQIYGKGRRPNQFMEKYFWLGKLVDIALEYSEITKKGSILYSYKPIADKQEKDDKEKAKKGAKDL